MNKRFPATGKTYIGFAQPGIVVFGAITVALELSEATFIVVLKH